MGYLREENPPEPEPTLPPTPTADPLKATQELAAKKPEGREWAGAIVRRQSDRV